MRNPKAAALWLLILLLLSGCSGAAASSEEPERDVLAVSARFQTEDGRAVEGGAAQFSTQEACCPLDSGGGIRAQGLPRSGEVRMTLLDPRQKERGAMTLSISEGSVVDATTGEDGVGQITVRADTEEVALLFEVEETGSLTCTLWLNQAGAPEKDGAQKGGGA